MIDKKHHLFILSSAILLAALSIFILISLLHPLPLHPGSLDERDSLLEHCEESTVDVYKESGEHLFSIAMAVTSGDRYISEDNIEYLIEEVNDKRAAARELGRVDLQQELTGKEQLSADLPVGGKKLVAIYHTHNGESYEPGPHAVEGEGDIHEVGMALENALKKQGLRVIHSENMHLPHDGAAYERSRATAVELSRERPDVILDLHRDGIPYKGRYLEKIDGKVVSKIRIVVGRQNQNSSVNDQFARQLKAAADEIYPGLIKDIFYGGGSYNQHINPNSLLLEFGTHVTTKEQAVASASLLAEPLKNLLYSEKAGAGRSSTAFRTILRIIILVTAAVLAYLFINEGSWQGVINRLRNFLPREILDRGRKRE